MASIQNNTFYSLYFKSKDHPIWWKSLEIELLNWKMNSHSLQQRGATTIFRYDNIPGGTEGERWPCLRGL